MQRTGSRVFVDSNETHSLMTNLFQSLTRADQDAWLSKMGLAREAEGGLASSASMRGFSNVSAIVAAAKTPKKSGAAGITGGSSRTSKFDFGSPRVSAALRLTGEDHTPEDETARPRLINISHAGADGKKGHMLGWFYDAAGYTPEEEQEKKPEQVEEEEAVTGGEENAAAVVADTAAAAAAKPEPPTELSLELALKEWMEQDHLGVPNPERLFEQQLAKFPQAKERGALNLVEFSAIFGHFERC